MVENSNAERAPQAPVPPDLNDCCLSGCVPCVFDLYDEALQHYRNELKAWEERRQADGAGAGPPA